MRLPWYKKNPLYSLYFNLKYIKGRQSKVEFNSEVEFYSTLIGKRSGSLIFDVGANHGDKSAVFLEIAETVVAAEPDRTNCEFLTLRFWKNKKFNLEDKAISHTSGQATLFLVNDGSGLNTIDDDQKDSLQIRKSYTITTTSLDLLIDKYGLPDFIKIDVEGHELNVLKGLTSKINCLSFEANLPGKLDDSISCLMYLASLNEDYQFNYGYDYGIVSETWLSLDDMKRFLQTTSDPYLNIYCKTE